jgi:flagellar export protein FliJ
VITAKKALRIEEYRHQLTGKAEQEYARARKILEESQARLEQLMAEQQTAWNEWLAMWERSGNGTVDGDAISAWQSYFARLQMEVEAQRKTVLYNKERAESVRRTLELHYQEEKKWEKLAVRLFTYESETRAKRAQQELDEIAQMRVSIRGNRP